MEPNKPPIVKYNNGIPEFVIIFDKDMGSAYYKLSLFRREDHEKLINEKDDVKDFTSTGGVEIYPSGGAKSDGTAGWCN